MIDSSTIAKPTYVGTITMLRIEQCGFISRHNVPDFEDKKISGKDIYFSWKVLQEDIFEGDLVTFNIGISVTKIWAYNVRKKED